MYMPELYFTHLHSPFLSLISGNLTDQISLACSCDHTVCRGKPEWVD